METITFLPILLVFLKDEKVYFIGTPKVSLWGLCNDDLPVFRITIPIKSFEPLSRVVVKWPDIEFQTLRALNGHFRETSKLFAFDNVLLALYSRLKRIMVFFLFIGDDHTKTKTHLLAELPDRFLIYVKKKK